MVFMTVEFYRDVGIVFASCGYSTNKYRHKTKVQEKRDIEISNSDIVKVKEQINNEYIKTLMGMYIDSL